MFFLLLQQKPKKQKRKKFINFLKKCVISKEKFVDFCVDEIFMDLHSN